MSDLVPFGAVSPELDPVPGYYRVLVTSGALLEGSLVYLLSIDERTAYLLAGEKQYTLGRETFAANFEFDPEGPLHRRAEMLTLMSEIAVLQAQGMRSGDLLRSFNPHLDETGDPTGMALVPSGAQSALEAKRSIALLRNEAGRVKADLESRQAAIRAMAEEQAIILRRQASELTEILNRAEEAVWTINLYLGESEQILRLAEGAPAPADTPITIRQLVLFMDEECAVAADDGGIDATSIDSFDQWLTSDPAHLAQVLPDPKGMVAIKPRRKTKDHNTGNAWVETELNKADKVTYFLLRNGSNLYRMWTRFDVGERLIPRTDEFIGYFSERRYNWETRQDETIRLDPGSDSFMQAEKRADAGRRHYMRAALILQGLIDRTTIFAPLVGKVNVGDEASYVSALRVITDADNVLADGRERFSDWFARINASLDVGLRVIGCFGNWEHGLRRFDRERREGNDRISPRGAGYPASGVLYTLEEKREDGLAFFYTRSESHYLRYEGEVAYQKRAVCLIQPNDRFILNFDAADEADMEFYLHSRLDRADYTYLFPTLKAALAEKRREAVIEAPFRLLLAGQIALAHGADLETASEAVPELVRWYKFKNRTHRALTADDSRALRMIVAEFAARAAQTALRATRSTEAEKVLADILAAEPTALLVAHKAGPDYVALVPANAENIFVHEQIWTTRGRREVRAWRTVDTRHERWQILHTSTRWADWKIGASRLEHLTDPERATLAEAGWKRLSLRKRWQNDPAVVRNILPLAVAIDPEGTLELYFADEPTVLPTENLLTNRITPRALGRARISWKRNAERAPLIVRLSDDHLSTDRGEMPWEVRYDGKPYGGQVSWQDEAALGLFRSELAAAIALAKEAASLRMIAQRAWNVIEKQQLARLEAAAYAKFLADFGDPELWAGHRKTLRLPTNLAAGDLLGAISALVERHLPIASLSVGQIIEQAAGLAGQNFRVPADLYDLSVPEPETSGT